MKKTERRIVAASKVEARAADDGGLILEGYAALFDSPSEPLPFIETIARGAFTKTLSENPDVRFLALNHDGMPLARTKAGTLTLTEDEIGLHFQAHLPDTNEARELHTAIDRGDITEMSFTFRAMRQKWSSDRAYRTIIEASLVDGDVSPVVYAAYTSTSVEARALAAKVTETLDALNAVAPSTKEGRSADVAALQSAFDSARTGLAQLLALEAVQLGEGMDKSWSISCLVESIEALLMWRSVQEWMGEEPIAAITDSTEMMSESSSISLRLAKARAFA